MAADRDWLRLDQQDAEAENAELRLRNERLVETALAQERLAELHSDRGLRLEARIGMLSARCHRLLRLAQPGRKPALTQCTKTRMMVRYVERGGLRRGFGKSAKDLVAEEFGVSVSTVERCIKEYKSKTVRVWRIKEYKPKAVRVRVRRKNVIAFDGK